MKKLTIASLTAVLAALLSHASPIWGGTLTVTSGPTFTPDTAFTTNTIKLDTTVGANLIQLTGNATITPGANTQVSVDISGDYSAAAGDMLTAAYSFVVDLNIITPVTYTVSGSAVVLGNTVPFNASGTLMSGLHKYEGTFAAPVSFLIPTSGTFTGTLTLDFGSGGSASAAPDTLDLEIQQIDIQLDPMPATLEAPAQPVNISTRGDVGTDDNVLIGGFIVTGTTPKQVVLRALGPSLTLSDVGGVLEDPLLELHDSTGALIATNDNWMDLSSDDQTTLMDNNLVPTEDAESALVRTLDPGPYTAIVRGVNNTTGVALVEAYDIDDPSSITNDSKLANISTRGNVDQNVLIGGFIVAGSGTGFSSMIVRGLGPSLAGSGLTGVLADPTIALVNENADVIATNDNWMDDPNMQSVIDNGLAPTDPNESAIFDILSPGAYTVILSGVNETTGIGLVEAYNVD